MEEVWKDIEGYEGLYQVSNLGRVKSLDRVIMRKKQGAIFKKGTILKPMEYKGYQYVFLCKDNKQRSIKIHRLVAKAFLHNPDKLPEVNHKDENKQNNRVDNLEWCNHKYNMNYGTWIDRRRDNFDYSYCYKRVNQYDLNGNFIKTWSNIALAQRELKICHISDCCNGKRKTAGKYIWEYTN